ncbi:MAG TPA: bifunctional nuclease family protein [Ilumatobacteraceae bacterium]|nr:bifunctional nuclease family protein [Ilumatobacteraceae bacterium]
MIPVELVGVRVDLPANTPVVLLREQGDGGRILPILIGHAEANAIHIAIQGLVPPRPLTHDLMLNVVRELGGTLAKVVITEVRDHTFYAELHVSGPNGELTISSRPSDAIALAVRCGAALFASEALLDLVGIVEVEDDDDDNEEAAIIDEFRDFLDDVSPEDFDEPF